MALIKIVLTGGATFPIQANSSSDFEITCSCSSTPAPPAGGGPLHPPAPKILSMRTLLQTPVSDLLTDEPTQVVVHAEPQDLQRLGELSTYVERVARLRPGLHFEVRSRGDGS